MIRVNDKNVEFTKFPDGTTSFRFDPSNIQSFNILWKYDGDHECILLWYLVKHIQAVCGRAQEIVLELPYVPNARMDRVKNSDEVFTLKWFAEFVNSLEFSKVIVLDPHSNVSTALIDRVCVLDAGKIVNEAVLPALACRRVIGLIYCYPDEGAMKRYSSQITGEYVFGIKHRDWRTGKIERLELANREKVKGYNVLIIDDICSRGGTFTRMATALKEAGAKDIYLYVSHCENTIHKGTVLKDGLIRHVFTTDSIYRGQSDKITVFPY